MGLALAAAVQWGPAAAAPDWDTVDPDLSAATYDNVRTVRSRTGDLRRDAVFRNGDTIFAILRREGVDRVQTMEAIRALEDLMDPSVIQAGVRATMSLEARAGADAVRLLALRIVGRGRDLTIVAQPDGSFQVPATPPAGFALDVRTRSGVLRASLDEELSAGGVPAKVIAEVRAAFAYDPDVPAEPKPGTAYTIIYETMATDQGQDHGPVLRYASIDVDGKPHRIYRYETGGNVAFFKKDGKGVAPVNLGHPVPNSRMSSPWGWRKHPVLGKRKFHYGVDFAAPRGTPIYAAADGVIEAIGWRGNYGRYMRIKHSGRVETAYGHMNGFAKNLKRGSKVKAGQVIAYIGSTGLSTGPHLYYEVLVDNKRVDPLKPNIAVPVNLAGESLGKFMTYVAQLDKFTN